MMDITRRIDKIIDARGLSLAKVERAAENLAACYESVRRFERLKAKIAVDDNYKKLFQSKPDILERIAGVSTKDFFDAHQEYSAKLKNLQERFSRKELHISFIGRAGQGKSLVMQNISGLGRNVIPSSEGGDCTGAKSVITNDSNATAVHAKIEFFNESEMIEIVNTYLDRIFHGSYNVGSIYEIKNLPIDFLKSKLDDSQVEENGLFPQLVKYVKHIGDFEADLGKTKDVPEADIEKYVAQFKHGDNATKYFNYLGVKLANIICKFPKVDAGKIVLVDTIGIGDTSIGTENKMLDTVENDSDAIIMMFRPDSLRPRLSNDEVAIVNKVSKRITPDYAREMFFMLLNKVTAAKGENVKYIAEVRQQIDERNFPIASILEVNCSNPSEVETELLNPVLNQLADRIGAVDEFLINRINELGQTLRAEYAAIASAFDKVFVGAANDDVKRALRSEIKTTSEINVLGGLRKLCLEKYFPLRDKSCEEWARASKEKLKTVFTSIPTKEKIVEMLDNGTINQVNAGEICTDMMRIEIINAFTDLNYTLDKLISDFKSEVLSILIDDDKGRLGKILPLENNSPQDWIDKFIEKTDCQNKYPKIERALRVLKEFTINVQGFLIYEIRRSLDVIDFSLMKHSFEINAPLADKNAVADEIRVWLDSYAEKVHNAVETKLRKINSVPNAAMFAALKDFYDRAAYAGRDEITTVVDEWHDLYEDWISAVWSEEYKNHFALKVQAEELENMIAEFKRLNVEEMFTVR